MSRVFSLHNPWVGERKKGAWPAPQNKNIIILTIIITTTTTNIINTTTITTIIIIIVCVELRTRGKSVTHVFPILFLGLPLFVILQKGLLGTHWHYHFFSAYKYPTRTDQQTYYHPHQPLINNQQRTPIPPSRPRLHTHTHSITYYPQPFITPTIILCYPPPDFFYMRHHPLPPPYYIDTPAHIFLILRHYHTIHHHTHHHHTYRA